ncbi:hypothetical protein NFI96_024791, partial [Prochilodus magdalenae]
TWITHENSSTPAALSSAFNFSHSPRQTGRGGGTGNFIDELDTLLSLFPVDGSPLLLLGDFNLPSDKLQSSCLQPLQSSFDLTLNPSPPTHRGGNTLDLVFSRPSPALDVTHLLFSPQPPSPPPPSSLTPEDFVTFFEEKVNKICQSFSPAPAPPSISPHPLATNSLTTIPEDTWKTRVQTLLCPGSQMRVMELEADRTPHEPIYVDEAGFNLAKTRRRGRNIIGKRATINVPGVANTDYESPLVGLTRLVETTGLLTPPGFDL